MLGVVTKGPSKRLLAAGFPAATPVAAPERGHQMRRSAGYSALALALTAALLSVPVSARYRRDVAAARERQCRDGGQVVETRAGPIEYATYGDGPPVLLSHELLGGFNHGLLIARTQFGDGFHTIAVSRFGYLNTPLPADPSPAAQADAYAALLDALGIQRAAVAGTSSGGASAIQFALRYPERASALVLLSGTGPGDAPPAPRPLMSVAFGSDFVWWAWQTYARSSLLSVMGVSAEDLAQRTPTDARFLAELLPRFLPISSRTAGALNDVYLTNLQIRTYPLERIVVPTLVITAANDTLAPYDYAKARAERIPGVRFVTLDRGGHLLLGQQERVKAELADFLGALMAHSATAH